jgi:hypothetical protein
MFGLNDLTFVWLVVVMTELAVAVISSLVLGVTTEEREVHVSMRATKLEMRKHRGPEAFVTRTKLERKLIALEKDAASCKDARFAQRAFWEARMSKAKYCLYAGLVALHWQSPLITLGSSSSGWGLWPLGWMFRFPGHPPGSVGVVAGVLVSQQGAARVLSFFV